MTQGLLPYQYEAEKNGQLPLTLAQLHQTAPTAHLQPCCQEGGGFGPQAYLDKIEFYL